MRKVITTIILILICASLGFLGIKYASEKESNPINNSSIELSSSSEINNSSSKNENNLVNNAISISPSSENTHNSLSTIEKVENIDNYVKELQKNGYISVDLNKRSGYIKRVNEIFENDFLYVNQKRSELSKNNFYIENKRAYFLIENEKYYIGNIEVKKVMFFNYDCIEEVFKILILTEQNELYYIIPPYDTTSLNKLFSSLTKFNTSEIISDISILQYAEFSNCNSFWDAVITTESGKEYIIDLQNNKIKESFDENGVNINYEIVGLTTVYYVYTNREINYRENDKKEKYSSLTKYLLYKNIDENYLDSVIIILEDGTVITEKSEITNNYNNYVSLSNW